MASAAAIVVNVVCTGNICRSPCAEVVLRSILERAALSHLVVVESSGTHGHTGWAADPRSCASAAARGYDLSAHRASALGASGLARADLLLALDASHLADMRRMAPSALHHKLRMLTAFARHCPAPAQQRAAARWANADIEDPYYEDAEAFERVLDGIECAAEGFVGAVSRVQQQTSGGRALEGPPLAQALLALLDADRAAAAAPAARG